VFSSLVEGMVGYSFLFQGVIKMMNVLNELFIFCDIFQHLAIKIDDRRKEIKSHLAILIPSFTINFWQTSIMNQSPNYFSQYQ
jgi:hypothetical protein